MGPTPHLILFYFIVVINLGLIYIYIYMYICVCWPYTLRESNVLRYYTTLPGEQ